MSSELRKNSRATADDHRPIFHMAPVSRWTDAADRADQLYVDPSLEAEGFIHCSTIDQLLIPANERFAGRTDLVVLVIDPAATPAAVVYEDCYQTGQAFPHIYGPIPVAAVTDVVEFPCEPDGSFRLPEGLRNHAQSGNTSRTPGPNEP